MKNKFKICLLSKPLVGLHSDPMMTCKIIHQKPLRSSKLHVTNHDGRPFRTGKPSGTTADTPNPWRCNDGAF
jgi:hypothetical protein